MVGSSRLAGIFLALAGLSFSGCATNAKPSPDDIEARYDPHEWRELRDIGNRNLRVAVIERIDPEKIVANDGFGQPILNTNPRSLLVFARDGNTSRAVASADWLIPPAGSVDMPCLDDPLEGGDIAVEDDVLIVQLNFWLSCGSYSVMHRTFRFSYEDSAMRLIGFDKLEFSRANGLGRETSINFLTGRKKVIDNVQVIEGDEGDSRPLPTENWSNVPRQTIRIEEIDLRQCDVSTDPPVWC